MTEPSPTACSTARLALSARLDREPHDAAALDAHLVRCGACRELERELARLVPAWSALEEPEAAPDLWPAIEARLPAARRPRARSALLARAAAALVGFLGAHQAGLALEREPEPRTHLLARWLAPPALEPHRLLAASPEYRLLLSRLPHTEEDR